MRPVDSRYGRNYAHHGGQEEYEQPEEPRESIGHGHQKDQHPQAEQPVVEPGYGLPGQARRDRGNGRRDAGKPVNYYVNSFCISAIFPFSSGSSTRCPRSPHLFRVGRNWAVLCDKYIKY